MEIHFKYLIAVVTKRIFKSKIFTQSVGHLAYVIRGSLHPQHSPSGHHIPETLAFY